MAPAPADADALRALLPPELSETCQRRTTDLDPGTVVYLSCTDDISGVIIYLSSFEDTASLDTHWSLTGDRTLLDATCEGGRFEGGYAVDGQAHGRIKCFEFAGPVVAWTIDDMLSFGWASSEGLTGDPRDLFQWWLAIAPVGGGGEPEITLSDDVPNDSAATGESYRTAADSFNDAYGALSGPGDPLAVEDLPRVADLLLDLRSELRPLAALAEGRSMDSALAELQELVREQLDDMPPSQAEGLTFLVDFALRDVASAADALRRRLDLPARGEDEYV